MTWNGQLIYCSGATTAAPKQIVYTHTRWQQSIERKASLLRMHGVNAGSRVFVGHPFAPWAIGQVFTEGALLAGATVLPLGLEAQREPFHSVLAAFGPTHVCGTARNLLRWARELARQSALVRCEVAFVAGEKLTDKRRQLVTNIWQCRVIDVYGMAEFDMVAAELPVGRGLHLVPEYRYAIEAGQSGPESLRRGLKGQLLVARGDEPWHRTGDQVEVLDQRHAWPNGGPTYAIRFIERLDHAITFACGAMLTATHVAEALSRSAGVGALQVVVTHFSDHDELDVLCVPSGSDDGSLCSVVARNLLAVAADMADSYRHGMITALRTRLVAEDGLLETHRGKVAALIERQDGVL